MTGNGASYEVQYYLRDHLGNVRMVMNEAGTIVQETEYFPFGLAIPKSGTDAVNKYQFLNREKQPETGWMDLMKRSYDPTISRFLQVDPVTESQEDYSVYQYGWNNPILRSDPNGDFPGILPLVPYLAAAAETAAATLLEATVTAGAITVAKDLVKKAGAGAGLYSPGVGMAMSTSNSGELTKANKNSGEVEVSNSSSQGKTTGPPNPNGKKGGEKHQEVNKREAKRMASEGKDVVPELRIPTQGGKKNYRYVDQAGTNPKTGEVEYVQVGKQNKNGTPVKRERDAMDDIEKATGIRPTFVPYNPFK